MPVLTLGLHETEISEIKEIISESFGGRPGDPRLTAMWFPRASFTSCYLMTYFIETQFAVDRFRRISGETKHYSVK